MESEKITKAQRTKKNVLETAMALMGERGYYNTTIRDICDKAGVSIGTFYTYFPSKRDIFADIFGRADDIFETEVAKQVKGGTVCDRIVDYFRYYAKLNLDSGIELMKVIYSAENTWFTKDRPMQKVLENLIAEGQKAGELSADTRPRDVAFFLFTLARGCCYNWCIRDGQYDLEDQMTDFITRALISYRKNPETNA